MEPLVFIIIIIIIFATAEPLLCSVSATVRGSLERKWNSAEFEERKMLPQILMLCVTVD